MTSGKNHRPGRFAVLLLAIAVCVFGGLWYREKQDHGELEQLCRYSAYRAYDRFSELRDGESDYDYRYGIAELTSFYNAYMNLTVETEGSTDPNCLSLNQLLGDLMAQPELTADQVNELILITSKLSEDISDPDAWMHIILLHNELNE